MTHQFENPCCFVLCACSLYGAITDFKIHVQMSGLFYGNLVFILVTHLSCFCHFSEQHQILIVYFDTDFRGLWIDDLFVVSLVVLEWRHHYLVMNEQALIPLAWMSVACAKLLGFSGKGKMRGHYPTQTQTQPHHRLPIGPGLVMRPWQWESSHPIRQPVGKALVQ